MHFSGTPEYKREFKKLARRYRSLGQDIGNLRTVVSKQLPQNPNRFSILKKNETFHIVKARLACRNMKNSSRSLRIVFAYYLQEDKVEFIEIFFKGDKEREDIERIKEYISQRS